ncbi:MAG: filamentous hemagglutinin N-terminal domain-containing protein [Cyanobacteria bacterium P01_F01_bin.4]
MKWHPYHQSLLLLCLSLLTLEKAYAQPVSPDGTTATSISGDCASSCRIRGNTISGENLFHSFSQFHIDEAAVVDFVDPGIDNIVVRVMEGPRSELSGLLRISEGNANLFLMNPAGVWFGPNARLDIGGSLAVTTANAMQFGDQGWLRASSTGGENLSLLTVAPSALMFNQLAAPIENHARALSGIDILGRPIYGLRVPDGQSFLLAGGDITLDGGGLNARGGQVNLAALRGPGMIGIGDNLHLAISDGVSRGQISLINEAKIEASGLGGGLIQVQGERISLRDGSALIANTFGYLEGQGIFVQADQVEINGIAQNGLSVSQITSLAFNTGDAGDILVETRQLRIFDGGEIATGTVGAGRGGDLVIDATESVELSNTPAGAPIPTGLFTNTVMGTGTAGDLSIETGRLSLEEGAVISTATLGNGQGGQLTIRASERVELSGMSADGIPSILYASTLGTGDAGNVAIMTDQLVVSDNAFIALSTQNLVGDVSIFVEGVGSVPVPFSGTGNAGNLVVDAKTVQLNQGGITAATTQGAGGNIQLTSQDWIVLRNQSLISSTAEGAANGGNIEVATPFLVILDDSGIAANAFEGQGGNIQVFVQGLFLQGDSQITASSELGIDGVVDVNAPNVLSANGLIDLPTQVLATDVAVMPRCQASQNTNPSEFIITGRGGIPLTPSESLGSPSILVDLGSLGLVSETHQGPGGNTDVELGDTMPNDRSQRAIAPILAPMPILEAQGWQVNTNGQLVLTAQTADGAPQLNLQRPADCAQV